MFTSFAEVTREGSEPERSLDFPLLLVGGAGRSYGFEEPDEAGLEGPARAMMGMGTLVISQVDQGRDVERIKREPDN
jgi:hypothetical protein